MAAAFLSKQQIFGHIFEDRQPEKEQTPQHPALLGGNTSDSTTTRKFIKSLELNKGLYNELQIKPTLK